MSETHHRTCPRAWGGLRNHDVAAETSFEILRALLSPPSEFNQVSTAMLESVSGGCWVENYAHSSMSHGEGELGHLSNSQIKTYEVEYLGTSGVDTFSDHEVPRRTGQSSARLASTNRNGWENHRFDDPRIDRARLEPMTTHHSSAKATDQGFESRRVAAEYTHVVEPVFSGEANVEGSSNVDCSSGALEPIAPVCKPGRAFRACSLDEISLTASSETLTPRLMPKVVQADDYPVDWLSDAISTSGSDCSVEVDEMAGCQLPPEVARPKGKIRRMWKSLQPRNSKRQRTVSTFSKDSGSG